MPVVWFWIASSAPPPRNDELTPETEAMEPLPLMAPINNKAGELIQERIAELTAEDEAAA